MVFKLLLGFCESLKSRVLKYLLFPNIV